MTKQRKIIKYFSKLGYNLIVTGPMRFVTPTLGLTNVEQNNFVLLSFV